ncbi:MAG: YIP1 family protein [Azospirillaceae bacterium]
MLDLNAFYNRIAGIIARPTETFESDGVPAPPWQVAAREHLVPLLVVSAAIYVAVTFLFAPREALQGLGLGLGELLLHAVIMIVVDFVSILLLARIAAAIASSLGTETGFDRAFVLMALALTPMLLGRSLGFLPLAGLFLVPASLIYSFVLIHRGAGLVLGLPAERRLMFTLGMFLAMLVISLVAALFVGASTMRV